MCLEGPDWPSELANSSQIELRRGEVVTRQSHKLENTGSNPVVAILQEATSQAKLPVTGGILNEM